MNTLAIIVLVLAALMVVGMFAESLAGRRDRKRYPAPGQLVTVEGRQMHMHFSGERQPGDPIVILETGMGSWSFYWWLMQSSVAKFTRVCSYDRFGFGWSDSGEPPRSAPRIAEELHAALQTAGEPGPYLLVGHSLGGVFVRQFARLYPNEICGMVLVDSAHEDQLERMPWARKEAQSIQSFFSFLAVLHRLGLLRLLGKPLLARFTSVSTPDEKQLFLATLLATWGGFKKRMLTTLPAVILMGIGLVGFFIRPVFHIEERRIS